jgi:hypothetical protein
MTELDWEAASRKRLESNVAAVVAKVHAMADRIAREAEISIRDAEGGLHQNWTYIRVAERMVHEVSWGVANLHLAGVIDAANDAQAARVEKAQKTGLLSRAELIKRAAYTDVVKVAATAGLTAPSVAAESLIDEMELGEAE